VKTDKGLSVLLIPRGDGVETKLIKTSYSPTAGTAFVSYDNVKVPVENLLGKENKGLQVILSNFNHERWYFPSHAKTCTNHIYERTQAYIEHTNHKQTHAIIHRAKSTNKHVRKSR
jgi:alkylation response protein AidB-like acyl-CoA dehydrogenase